MKYNKFLCLIVLAFFIGSCTDLKEELREDLTQVDAAKSINVEQLLKASYDGMRVYHTQDRIWSAQTHTTDEAMGPTRGPDWDDNGIWRSLHAHNWTAEHGFLTSTFSELLQVVYSTTNILQFNPTPQQAAEARLLRAFTMLSVLDGWGQVPFRKAGSNLLDDAEVLSPAQAVDFILAEINEITKDLPDGPAYKCNKNAAKALKMRLLINKGMYLNREAPTFDAANMTEIAALADEITASGKFSLDDNYFDNFAPDNDQVSSENIFTSENRGGSSSGNVRSRWFCTLHYNQNPSGWNGFTTLGSFYDSFEDGDTRKSSSYAGMTDVSGIKAGFLIGQQFDETGKALNDRKNNPLAFTREVAIKESGANLEVTGIRVIKYPIDYKNIKNDNADNDYVLLRYADVLLMKAEALLRSGNAAGGLTIVNDIRAKRKASALASLNVDNLLAERGREFFWEGIRRTDLIRFGKFLAAWEEKPASGKERLLFPIPTQSLASNPNLKQNPGY